MEGMAHEALSLPWIQPGNTRVRRLIDRARQLADDPSSLLLRGEVGAGKCALARWIHHNSARRFEPCIVVRATSDISSDALLKMIGSIESNSPGITLILEEIAEFSDSLQQALLKLMSADYTHRAIRAKIIVTSSQDLPLAARKKVVCEDLVSRLMDESIYLPPLRERTEDITLMADHMLAYFATRYHHPVLALEPEAKLALLRHSWPGNLHELRNVMDSAALLSKRDRIGESDLRLRSVTDSSHSRSGQFLSLDALEKQHILRVLQAAPTLEEAARILHVDITTLWRKRRRYGI